MEDGGAGAVPVVFVHSFSGNSTHWTPQLSHPRARRRATAFDLRGHGKSAAPANGDYRIEAFAEDIGAVADALGLQRFVIVGHSLGGSAATAYAAGTS